jgi:hypothetical protein
MTPPPTASWVLRVNAIHQDVTFTNTMTAAVRREIKDLAHWLELDPDAVRLNGYGSAREAGT